jgi:membrane fusion protein, multidrug efflux system
MSLEENDPGRPPSAHPAPHDLGFALPAPAKVSPIRALVGFAVVAVVLGVMFLVAYLPKRRLNAELVQSAKADSRVPLRVNVVTPTEMTSDRAILLPGTAMPLQSTVIDSRANGYLRRWYVDMGDKVSEGQLLAEIETPELDQELVQARAQVAQAEAGVAQAVANRDFSKTNLERYQRLTPQGLTSQQELDQHAAQSRVDEASVGVAQANAGAMRANIARVTRLKEFARVVAPFAGTVTSRSVEIGALVTAGNATPLFNLAATDPVRVFVQVPQDVAPSVRANVPAEVRLREYPARVFRGTVARSAGALDPGSRTMNTEVRVPNPDGAILTGMYAEVSLTLPNPHRVYEVPATALFNNAQGLRLAVVGSDRRVRFVTVGVERDTGATVQISTGLGGGERVVKLANAGLVDGSEVEVAP